MKSASASNSPGATATSCTQATTPNVPTPPKLHPLLGQIYSLTRPSTAHFTRGRQRVRWDECIRRATRGGQPLLSVNSENLHDTCMHLHLHGRERTAV